MAPNLRWKAKSPESADCNRRSGSFPTPYRKALMLFMTTLSFYSQTQRPMDLRHSGVLPFQDNDSVVTPLVNPLGCPAARLEGLANFAGPGLREGVEAHQRDG